MTALIISGGQGQLRGLRGGGGRPQGDVGGVQADQAGVTRFEGDRGGGADAEFRAFRVPGQPDGERGHGADVGDVVDRAGVAAAVGDRYVVGANGPQDLAAGGQVAGRRADPVRADGDGAGL